MIIINKTVRLVAAPVPPFVGTRIGISVPDDSLDWGIKAATLADGADFVTVSWGDGSEAMLGADIADLVHTYPRGGAYEVRISDGISTLQVSSAADSAFCKTYAPMVTSFVSDAQRLATINPQSFRNAVSMREMDLSESGIVQFRPLAFMDCLSLTSLAGLPRSLQTIFCTAFSGSVNIAGRVDFPSAKTISGNVSTGKNLFSGCNGITEIHFAAENEETVKSSSAYRNDPKLGAPNAEVLFDL